MTFTAFYTFKSNLPFQTHMSNSEKRHEWNPQKKKTGKFNGQ